MVEANVDDAAAEWRGGNRRRNFTNGPVIAGPGDVMWKGEECVRPVLAALGPKTTSVDEAALRSARDSDPSPTAPQRRRVGRNARSKHHRHRIEIRSLGARDVQRGVRGRVVDAGERRGITRRARARTSNGRGGFRGRRRRGRARRRDAKPGLAPGAFARRWRFAPSRNRRCASSSRVGR